MTERRTSILAIHPGALGDVILFGHLLAALRRSASIPSERPGPGNSQFATCLPDRQVRNPQFSPSSTSGRLSHITIVAGGEKGRLLAAAGLVDAAMDYDSLPMHELFSDSPLQRCRLGSMLGKHEWVVGCFVEADSSAARRLVRMCGAGALAALPIRPPLGFDGHLTDLWRRQLGLTGPACPATWAIEPSWRVDAAEALGELGLSSGVGYVVIHPGAGAADKCWAAGRFIAVAAELRAAGLDVVFALGPAELDRWPRERISRLGEAGAVLADAPLTRLAGVLAGAAAFVGNDSGVAHLAAAVGAPSVVLFGPTSPTHFAPLGRSVQCVAADTMAGIATAQVLDAVWKLRRA